jgi:hypothetical protein
MMADKFSLYRICPECDGKGVVKPPGSADEIECPVCLHADSANKLAGLIFWGEAIEKIDE